MWLCCWLSPHPANVYSNLIKCGSSNSVLVLSLPLCFVVVGVAAVQLIEHLPDSHLQPGRQKLDILLHTQVQYPIDPLCEMQLDVWSQGNLEGQIRGHTYEKGEEGREDRIFKMWQKRETNLK